MINLITSLRSHTIARTVKRGTNILFQGEIPRNVFIVRDGFVRAYTITSNGDERTIALYGKDDIFPITWVIGETTQSLFYYEALTDVRVLTVTKDNFLSVIKRDVPALNELFKYIGNQYTAMLFRITGLEQSRAVDKIGYTLYYLLFRYGKELENNRYLINVKLTQTSLASLVGLTRESTAKNLKVLRNKKIIGQESGYYTVDKPALENFIKDENFKDLQI